MYTVDYKLIGLMFKRKALQSKIECEWEACAFIGDCIILLISIMRPRIRFCLGNRVDDTSLVQHMNGQINSQFLKRMSTGSYHSVERVNFLQLLGQKKSFVLGSFSAFSMVG
jgi:hypothetical protein